MLLSAAGVPEHGLVQEQIEQIEHRNRTHDVDKRGAHCAVALTTYHRPRSRSWHTNGTNGGSVQPTPTPDIVKGDAVMLGRAGNDSLIVLPVARVVLSCSVPGSEANLRISV